MSIDALTARAPIIRRSDDNLKLNCKTENDKTPIASVLRSMGSYIVISAVFHDLLLDMLETKCSTSEQSLDQTTVIT
jgi:hypothetical protein